MGDTAEKYNGFALIRNQGGAMPAFPFQRHFYGGDFRENHRGHTYINKECLPTWRRESGIARLRPDRICTA